MKPAKAPKAVDPELVRRCNCAGCRKELSSPSDRERVSPSRRPECPPPVAGRILGRPYCATCLRANREEGLGPDPGDAS